MPNEVYFHERSASQLGQPTNTSGTPRPLLDDNLPWHTVHYAGVLKDQIYYADNGIFSDIEDVFRFVYRLEQVARAAGKPFEYNTVIPVMRDNSSHVVAYADEYRAAHSAGENSLSHGTLFAVGVGTDLNRGAIDAFRWWNAVLRATGRLASISQDEQILPHRRMPDARTVCPGIVILKRMPDLRVPYEWPVEDPPEEDPMFIAKLKPEWSTPGLATYKSDVHFAVFPSGLVRHATGPDTEGAPVRLMNSVEHFNIYARAANKMSGANIRELQV